MCCKGDAFSLAEPAFQKSHGEAGREERADRFRVTGETLLSFFLCLPGKFMATSISYNKGMPGELGEGWRGRGEGNDGATLGKNCFVTTASIKILDATTILNYYGIWGLKKVTFQLMQQLGTQSIPDQAI